jgi:hypothetical protein
MSVTSATAGRGAAGMAALLAASRGPPVPRTRRPARSWDPRSNMINQCTIERSHAGNQHMPHALATTATTSGPRRSHCEPLQAAPSCPPVHAPRMLQCCACSSCTLVRASSQRVRAYSSHLPTPSCWSYVLLNPSPLTSPFATIQSTLLTPRPRPPSPHVRIFAHPYTHTPIHASRVIPAPFFVTGIPG